ncbi:hypothetical protein [Porphyromonas pogonae]|uniref:hypothetical protein n=1 Tax=Porphyromonas pogonae TaxID=867595 RepID=UPI002E76F6FD|nr:hypothetical protein [Porphyromonas pogonae]
MSRNISVAIIAVAVSMAGLLQAKAQNNSTESPYTRFGYGRLGDRAVNAARGMGGIGIGVRDGMVTNPMNPASYSAVDSLTFIFDVAASFGFGWYSEGGKDTNRKLGNFEYATMLFPVSKHVGISAGIMPFSYAGYQFGSLEKLPGGEKESYTRLYSGNGNINDLYLGVGASLFKGFSLGVNASFLFGNISHDRKVLYSTPAPLNPIFNDELRIKGFKMDVGAQYSMVMGEKEDRKLTIGATYSPSFNLNSRLVNITTFVNSSSTGGRITVVENDTIKSSNMYNLPHSFGLGASYSIENKLLLGADVQYSRWKEVKFAPGKQNVFQDRLKVAMGAEIIPDHNDRSLFKQTRYRFGVNAENSYLKVPVGNDFKGYYKVGASVGLGIPIVDRRSMLNLTVSYDRLIPPKNAIVERCLMFTLGLTFNESWFRKITVD